MKLECTRCGKRLSRKSARLIDGKPLCSPCMFAPLDALREQMMDCYQFGTVTTPDRSGEADKTAKQGLAEGESGLPRKGSSKP